MPTILSCLGYPIPSGIDGEAVMNSGHPVIAELMMGIAKKNDNRVRDLRAIYQGKEKYIWASNGSNELYNLGEDPGEKNNLLETFPHKVQAMEKMLKQWLTTSNLLDLKKETVTIDKSTEEKFRALGYVR
jgi:arylsulfatase A-like enzyme